MPVYEERTRRMDTLVAGRVPGSCPPRCHHPPCLGLSRADPCPRTKGPLSCPGMRPGPLVCLLHHLLSFFFFFRWEKINRHLDFAIDTKNFGVSNKCLGDNLKLKLESEFAESKYLRLTRHWEAYAVIWPFSRLGLKRVRHSFSKYLICVFH